MCCAAAAAAAIAKPARPSSFLQAAGGSAPSEGNRGPQPGRGGAPGAGGGRGRGRAPPRAPPVTVPNEDFDFEEMMKKFNKQAGLKVGFIVVINIVTMSACFADISLYDSIPMITPGHCCLKGDVQTWQPSTANAALPCCALCCGNAWQHIAQRSMQGLRPHAHASMLSGVYIRSSGYVDMLQEAESKPEQPKPAEKPTFEDDFFDSISSDATGTPAAFCPPAKYS